MLLLIPKETADKIASYLARRPYIEVRDLMDAMFQLKPHVESNEKTESEKLPTQE